MSPRTSTPTEPYTPGEQMDRPVDPAAREWVRNMLTADYQVQF